MLGGLAMRRSALGRLKDAALEKTLLLLLRPKFERYGEIRAVSVDTTEKRVTADIRLLGDPIPLEITDAFYRVEPGDGETCVVTFYGVRASKPWLQHLIEDRAPEIRVPLPGYVRTLL